MKTNRKLLSATATAALCCCLAFAQQTAEEQPQAERQSSQNQSSDFHPYRVSDFEGSRVVNSEGDRLGTLKEIVFNVESGTFPYAIIASGGFLGVGADWKPVPPESIQIRPVDEGYEFLIEISEDEWKRAPMIDRDKIDDLAIEVRSQEIYEFYGADWDAQQQRTAEYGAQPEERTQTAEIQPEQQTESMQEKNQADLAELTQNLESDIEEALTQAGAEQQASQEQAEQLAQQFVQQKPESQQMAEQLKNALADAGASDEQAQQQSQELAQQINQQLDQQLEQQMRRSQETQYGAPDESRQQEPMASSDIESQIEEAMSRAGIDQEQAQTEAARLADKFSAESPTKSEIQTELEMAMVEAGVGETQAREEAQALSEQISTSTESEQSNLYLASELRHTTIVNDQLEEVGEVTDFIINAAENQLVFVLFGEETGLLQSVDQEYAVSPNALTRLNSDQIELNIAPQDLREARTLTTQQLSAKAEELANIDRQEAQQQPQVFRYQEIKGAPGVYGSPDRERSSNERKRENDVRQTKQLESGPNY